MLVYRRGKKISRQYVSKERRLYVETSTKGKEREKKRRGEKEEKGKKKREEKKRRREEEKRRKGRKNRQLYKKVWSQKCFFAITREV